MAIRLFPNSAPNSMATLFVKRCATVVASVLRLSAGTYPYVWEAGAPWLLVPALLLLRSFSVLLLLAHLCGAPSDPGVQKVALHLQLHPLGLHLPRSWKLCQRTRESHGQLPPFLLQGLLLGLRLLLRSRFLRKKKATTERRNHCSLQCSELRMDPPLLLQRRRAGACEKVFKAKPESFLIAGPNAVNQYTADNL